MPPSKKAVTKPAVMVIEMAVPEDVTENPFEQVLERIKPLIGTDDLPNVTSIHLGINDFAEKAIKTMKDEI